jgi:4-hydroxy-tetrahydrodipicolinate synthase
VVSALRGTWFICPTPFDDGGEVDEKSLHTLVDSAARWGVDGLTVLGVMGEVAALTDDERDGVLATVCAAARDRLPVAVGCSAPSAQVAAGRVRTAQQHGAAAVMIAAPTLARDTDTIGAFYAAATANATVPVIVQDEPTATGVVLPVSVLLTALDAAGADVVKLEDPPTPPKITRLLAARSELTVFGGLGGVSALWELGRGAAGTMTGFAFPEVLRAIRLAVERGDPSSAARVFDRYLPYITYEGQLQVGLSIRKEVLRRRGAIATARTRVGRALDDVSLAELGDVLSRVGLVAGPDAIEVAG